MNKVQLYLWTTPNGYKPLIMLEETKIPYTLHKVRLDGEQKQPSFLEMNPNGKIPVLVDSIGEENITVFESGAILIYLANKTGQFLPSKREDYYNVIQWLMFQMASVGPMFGQLGHFLRLSERNEYAITRYSNEVKRLYGLLNTHLSQHTYVAGEYSIADISLFPWVRKPSFYEMDFVEYPFVESWCERIAKREAVQKAMSVKFK